MKQLSIIALSLILLTLTVKSEEPQIKGKVVAYVEQVYPNTLIVDYLTGRKIKKGQKIAVEWGNGNYFTTVLAVKGSIVTTSYHPASTDVEIGATVKIVR